MNKRLTTDRNVYPRKQNSRVDQEDRMQKACGCVEFIRLCRVLKGRRGWCEGSGKKGKGASRQKKSSAKEIKRAGNFGRGVESRRPLLMLARKSWGIGKDARLYLSGT